jgi:hypothetical protein
MRRWRRHGGAGEIGEEVARVRARRIEKKNGDGCTVKKV